MGVKHGGILSTIGETPLVELVKLSSGLDFRVYAKLEMANPGGSIKDRSALSMLADRIASGELVPGRSTVVESSSGNLAVGIAQICRYHGIRFICVVDAKTSSHNIGMLHAYGAEVEMVNRPGADGEYLPSRIRRVQEIADTLPGAYWPNQYANLLNPRAHEQTMREIVSALDAPVDYLFSAVSSFGTLRGCAQYVAAHSLSTRLVAVDAVGSRIFDGQPAAKRLLPGHGAAIRPALFDRDAAHEVVHVTDGDCVRACRRLVATEAILAGASSGAVVAALLHKAPEIPAGARCVLILADRGDRYLQTVFSDDWVDRNLNLNLAGDKQLQGALPN
ncbi:2,3-diaminopropionate biosynthesis protein SbnA [Nocardia terpenica]|uniref:2,3-diaminopropionate biosynthesis protein SbnA n=1 Tax=Nocardia terpenica TaxID=455432 RepID=UPI001893019D|nr:2,3-diaminopropionate biosynthesis protein SbnA [Nocardia terpenica]MBF6065957.1 2,3-diaminopropionate biosynthesis protein SbnA [Nocardia terpenica]MBF6108847.1 2,3-diaminopropionate biosynthesis protein SbnA [Nocardia terpenica]MBF6116201.1 2,3-diaminopropionate biosynthesis protein SbnA [Nocardia terpenica]MBF6123202.1 2,3-diaminopropionate biosynthesis protein SbnA [Nocardia terpenica]MBF6153116.1 2,3-diaminopropionate biosynthesis protein SbnA [Nocardia terpenica]